MRVEISNEDYLAYSGQDLNAELTALLVNCEDNPAPRFINGIQEWCWERLITNYDFNGKISKEKMYKGISQEEWFKRGVIYQIDYVLQNATISNDSGYNQDMGRIIPRAELDRIALAPNAYMAFRSGGMANYKRR